MVDVSIDIDQAAVSRLAGILDAIQRETPRRLATETRRAAIYICQSLRARTKKAPKRARPNEYRAEPSNVPPRYIHGRYFYAGEGRPLLRRWSLTRKLGTPDQYTKHYYVYTKAKRGRGGRMIGKSPAQERRELVRNHGGISRAGLAKTSWGWVMKQIYNAEPVTDMVWKKTKRERRDPRNYVKGIFKRVAGGAFAEIRNSLDYIMDALRPGALAEAVDAASKRLEYNVVNNIERMAAK